MMFYFKKIPKILQWLIPGIEWNRKGSRNIYLTFDDGPNPDSTLEILQLLRKSGALATFFVVGEKVEKWRDVFQKIVDEGHAIGNHGYKHISGWNTAYQEYVGNVHKGSEVIESRLFRPPFGRMTPWQLWRLKKEYHIIMWDLMPGDFDPRRDANQLLATMKKNLTDGRIIVLHDLPKTLPLLLEVLPDYISYAKNKGYSFQPLDLK